MEQDINKTAYQAPAEEIQGKYPWYDIPHLQNYRTGRSELPLRLQLQARFRPEILYWVAESTEAQSPAVPSPTDCNPTPTTENNSDIFALIDNFLADGEHKISIADTTTDEFTAPSDKLPEGTLLTEELASVYAKQGLYESAIEIYRGLSLLNPEKSVYFAELIVALEASAKGTVAEQSKSTPKQTTENNN